MDAQQTIQSGEAVYHLDGIVRVPREVAVPLLHNGGYVIHDCGIAGASEDTLAPTVMR